MLILLFVLHVSHYWVIRFIMLRHSHRLLSSVTVRTSTRTLAIGCARRLYATRSSAALESMSVWKAKKSLYYGCSHGKEVKTKIESTLAFVEFLEAIVNVMYGNWLLKCEFMLKQNPKALTCLPSVEMDDRCTLICKPLRQWYFSFIKRFSCAFRVSANGLDVLNLDNQFLLGKCQFSYNPYFLGYVLLLGSAGVGCYATIYGRVIWKSA